MTIVADYTRFVRSAVTVAGAGALLWAGSAAFTGCSSPDADAKTDAVGPDRAQFDYVAPVLARRCGSIDCHGSRYRNFRVYGYGSQRADGGKTPDSPKSVTPDEAQRTYDSLVALEPEIMADVVKSGGVGPERLTFVRKGRGQEDHKGDQRIVPGDNSDRCITSWLANKVDTAACDLGGCVVTADGGIRSIDTCP